MYKPIHLNLIAIYFVLKFIFIQNVLTNEQVPPDYATEQMSIIEDNKWMLNDQTNRDYKQVPGIAFNQTNLSIFHRSTVVWDAFSFDMRNVYMHQDQPIIVDPVLTFNSTGHFVSSLGKNMFFMPHGLSFDSEGNVFLTDVALHQVFKFNKNNLTAPELVFGKRFVPGESSELFCKPTDVQVSSKTKNIFISDGYCNSRVLVYDKNGRFIKEFGREHQMVVVHSLSLIDELNLVCVADRENGRALCFDAGNENQSNLGEFRKELKIRGLPGQLYAIQNVGTYLFGVLVYSNYGGVSFVKVLVFDLKKDNEPIFQKDMISMKTPHDITADKDSHLYVSEIADGTKLVKRYLINTNQKQLVLREDSNRPKSKRVDDTKAQEDELKSLATKQQLPETTTISSSIDNSDANANAKSKKNSLLLFIIFVSCLLIISIILFALKKRIGIENYFRNLGLPTKVIYSKDSYINDPERSGFNLLREEEENLFDFELENNSSESEVEEFNFKHVRKV